MRRRAFRGDGLGRWFGLIVLICLLAVPVRPTPGAEDLRLSDRPLLAMLAEGGARHDLLPPPEGPAPIVARHRLPPARQVGAAPPFSPSHPVLSPRRALYPSPRAPPD